MIALLSFLTVGGCDTLRATVVDLYPQSYAPDLAAGSGVTVGPTEPHTWPSGVPRFSTDDAQRTQAAVHLQPVLTGTTQPTEMVFFPDSDSEGLLLEKGGVLQQFDLTTGSITELMRLSVSTESEQGLLGAALHPQYATNATFYLHTSQKRSGDKVGVISEWKYNSGTPSRTRTVLEVVQPYANHNGGTIAFGPDGYLFVGLGDGGWRDDPHNHGQTGTTLLGSMLRIDVDGTSGDKGYAVPDDNPWVGNAGVADEAWAIGLRNPWKFSFTPDGDLIVADVGQNAFEEVNLVRAKDNLGWNTKEASHCFPEGRNCTTAGLVDPIYEYPHREGKSITGGYVSTSSAVPAIEGMYVFGDFVTGRLWAIDVPKIADGTQVPATALGQWPVLPSTFARSASGRLFVTDFGSGTVFRIDAG